MKAVSSIYQIEKKKSVSSCFSIRREISFSACIFWRTRKDLQLKLRSRKSDALNLICAAL